MINIGVLVSGNGTNLQAVIDAINIGKINGIIRSVISNRSNVYALERARLNNINSIVVPKRKDISPDEYSDLILSNMKYNDIDLIVMAGFLCIVSGNLIEEYKNRIINIHPSLIPAFCGPGMYGLKVHEAVLERGVKVTGATTHFVNGIPDGGPIIHQKTVLVRDDDTPLSLQKRVMEEAEWQILVESISWYCEGKLEVVNEKVIKKVM